MNDRRKDNFPRPQARLPLDAEDWSWREDRGSTGPVPDRDSLPVRSRPGTKTASKLRSSKGSEYRTCNARPVPRMPKTRPETQVRSKGITLAGTLLILGLTVLAFAGGRLFGRVEEPDPVPTAEMPEQTVPAPELAAVAPKMTPVVETPIALPA